MNILYGMFKDANRKLKDASEEDTIYFAEREVKEKEVLEAVNATNDIIDRLHENSKIFY